MRNLEFVGTNITAAALFSNAINFGKDDSNICIYLCPTTCELKKNHMTFGRYRGIKGGGGVAEIITIRYKKNEFFMKLS